MRTEQNDFSRILVWKVDGDIFLIIRLCHFHCETKAPQIGKSGEQFNWAILQKADNAA